MSDRYRVYTSRGIFGDYFLNEDTWIEDCNKLIDEGWIPLGGVQHYGQSGLQQTMYLPVDELTQENIRRQESAMCMEWSGRHETTI